jgi:hypothetical protein
MAGAPGEDQPSEVQEGHTADPIVGHGHVRSDAGTVPDASPAASPVTHVPDLRPEGLRGTPAEIDFMANLGALVPTPRAAKRLVNLYRLIRIGIPDSQLAAFARQETGSSYQIVQLLLAVLCGSGTMAREVFQVILASPGEADLLTVLGDAGASPAQHEAFGRISAQPARIGMTMPLPVSVADYQAWCPAVARYSLYTRDVAGPPPAVAPRR